MKDSRDRMVVMVWLPSAILPVRSWTAKTQRWVVRVSGWVAPMRDSCSVAMDLELDSTSVQSVRDIGWESEGGWGAGVGSSCWWSWEGMILWVVEGRGGSGFLVSGWSSLAVEGAVVGDSRVEEDSVETLDICLVRRWVSGSSQ